MSSSKYTKREQIDMSQKWLLEKRKRMFSLIENVNQKDLKKKTWNKWRKKGGRILWEKYKMTRNEKSEEKKKEL